MGKGRSRAIIWNGRELVWAGDGKVFFRGVGKAYLKNEIFEEAFRKLLTDYKPNRRYKLCLFLPCSYGKPYSQSYIHYFIIKALRSLGDAYSDVHQVILSNVGVVPRELEEHTPFIAYDWNPACETEEIKQLYVKVLAGRLAKYIKRFMSFYGRFACYLRRESESYKAVQVVEEELGVQIPNLALDEVPAEEIRAVSLTTYNRERDLCLIAPPNLDSLVKGLKRLLTGEQL
jgi:predicted RNA-binding protein